MGHVLCLRQVWVAGWRQTTSSLVGPPRSRWKEALRRWTGSAAARSSWRIAQWPSQWSPALSPCASPSLIYGLESSKQSSYSHVILLFSFVGYHEIDCVGWVILDCTVGWVILVQFHSFALVSFLRMCLLDSNLLSYLSWCLGSPRFGIPDKFYHDDDQ